MIGILDDGVGRAYAETKENSSAKELGKFIGEYFLKEPKIVTNK